MDIRMIILLILAVLLALIITLLIGTLVNMYSKNYERPIAHKKINEETLVVTKRSKPVKAKKERKVKESRIIFKPKKVREIEDDDERMIEVYEEIERKLATRNANLRKEEKDSEVLLAEEKRREEKIQKKNQEKVIIIQKETEPQKEYVTYTKIKFYRSDREFIYVVPKNTYLIEGQKIKVRIDADTVRVAKVIKGNYTREKYKGYEYKVINIVK